jgi:hypothetical protein
MVTSVCIDRPSDRFTISKRALAEPDNKSIKGTCEILVIFFQKSFLIIRKMVKFMDDFFVRTFIF